MQKRQWHDAERQSITMQKTGRASQCKDRVSQDRVSQCNRQIITMLNERALQCSKRGHCKGMSCTKRECHIAMQKRVPWHKSEPHNAKEIVLETERQSIVMQKTEDCNSKHRALQFKRQRIAMHKTEHHNALGRMLWHLKRVFCDMMPYATDSIMMLHKEESCHSAKKCSMMWKRKSHNTERQSVAIQKTEKASLCKRQSLATWRNKYYKCKRQSIIMQKTEYCNAKRESMIAIHCHCKERIPKKLTSYFIVLSLVIL